jgi:hypothetical protein
LTTVCPLDEILRTIVESIGKLRAIEAEQGYKSVISIGGILMCKLRDTDNIPTSPTHEWNDCACASKGFYRLAIQRPKNEGYEYYGPVRSEKGLKRGRKAGERYEYDLDDEFFVGKEVKKVTLV